jgi:ComF family protein
MTTPAPAWPTYITQLWYTSLEWIFPPVCEHCGRVDTSWCAACSLKLSELPLAVSHKTVNTIPIASTGVHSGVLRDAVHTLKYTAAVATVAPLLAHRIANALTVLNWTFDILVPVPLHATRRAERGYNQSEQLCNHLTQELHRPHVPQAVQRQRNTPHQVGLNAVERLANVAEAFWADSQMVAGQRVLVIDDVVTTGATLSACAQAIFTAGATSVAAITLTAAF